MRTLTLALEAPPEAAARERDDGEEARLLLRMRAGDRAAAEALVERTYGEVFRFLLRLAGGDREAAADATQETYRKVWEAIGSFQGRSRLSTWITRIAWNTWLNSVRRPRLVVPLEWAPDPADTAPAADDAAGDAQFRARVRHEVAALPEDLRFTVAARFWGERSADEIGRLEGISGVAVRKRLKRALGLLEMALRSER